MTLEQYKKAPFAVNYKKENLPKQIEFHKSLNTDGYVSDEAILFLANDAIVKQLENRWMNTPSLQK